MKRRYLPMAIAVVALPLIAMGASDCDGGPPPSRQDLPESKVVQVKPNATVYVSPDLFPNIVTYCLPGGYRAFLTTRDVSSAAARILPDPDCKGNEAGESPSARVVDDVVRRLLRGEKGVR